MQEEMRKKMKQEYQKNFELKAKLKKARHRILELEEDPKIKEYLMLIEQITELDDKVYEDDAQYLAMLFADYSLKNDSETNQMLVYLGTFGKKNPFDFEHRPIDISVDYDDDSAEYSMYYDLEKGMSAAIIVPVQERTEFEQDHTVIFPERTTSKEFYRLRQLFATCLMKEKTQEKAVTKFLSLVPKKNNISK